MSYKEDDERYQQFSNFVNASAVLPHIVHMNSSFKSKLKDYFKESDYQGTHLVSGGRFGLKDMIKLNSDYGRFQNHTTAFE